MPFSQIDDKLFFNNETRVVKASGPLFRPQDLDNLDPGTQRNVREPIPDENFKTFTVRVCQTDHDTGRTQHLAEGTWSDGDPLTKAFKGDGTWKLELPYLRDDVEFMSGMDGTATAVLVFDAGGDLFTLAWSECVLLVDEQSGAQSGGHADH